MLIYILCCIRNNRLHILFNQKLFLKRMFCKHYYILHIFCLLLPNLHNNLLGNLLNIFHLTCNIHFCIEHMCLYMYNHLMMHLNYVCIFFFRYILLYMKNMERRHSFILILQTLIFHFRIQHILHLLKLFHLHIYSNIHFHLKQILICDFYNFFLRNNFRHKLHYITYKKN